MNILIFGTGRFYENRKETLSQHNIVGFIDNNVEKWGQILDGVMIHAPYEGVALNYDKIILMAAGTQEMRRQLQEELQVDNRKILLWDELGGYSDRNHLEIYYKKKPCQAETGQRILVISTNLNYNGGSLAAVYAVKALQEQGCSAILAAPDGDRELIEEINKDGVTVYLYKNLRYASWEELVWIEPFQYVFVNTYQMVNCACLIHKYKPVIWWIHEPSVVYRELRTINHSLLERNIHGINMYAVSNIAKDNLEHIYGSLPLKLLPYGIPDERTSSASVPCDKSKVIFAVVGYVGEIKGQDIFLDAIENLSQEERELAEFWIIGSMNENDSFCLNCIERSNRISGIKLLGALNRREIYNVYSKIDVVVCPSREDPLPIVVTEGLMFGKTCIVSSYAGNSQYITDMENGLICKGGDSQDLRDKMRWALGHRDSCKRLGENARQLYEAYFSIECFGSRLMQALSCENAISKFEKNSLISVIVPVYNVKLYLKQCIESIRNQTCKNLEIILVDDGSTDGSAEMCDDFSRLDDRIRVIHKTNGGNTSARLAGLKAASGYYVGFVDSDDWIDPEMYETLLSEMEKNNADIITSGYYTEFGGADIIIKDALSAKVYKSQEERLFLYSHMLYYGDSAHFGIGRNLVTKIFKREILCSVFADMDIRMQFGEDAAGVYVYLINSNVVCVTDKAFYHYRARFDSITHEKDEWFLQKINVLYNFLLKWFKTSEYSEVLMEQLNCFLLEHCLKVSRFLKGMDPKVSIPEYLIEFAQIDRKTSVVLYGAGAVGKIIYRHIKTKNVCHIAAWVDKNCIDKGDDVSSTDCLDYINYDYIIIAVGNQRTADEIRGYLLSQGISKEKILWFKYKTMMDCIINAGQQGLLRGIE